MSPSGGGSFGRGGSGNGSRSGGLECAHGDGRDVAASIAITAAPSVEKPVWQCFKFGLLPRALVLASTEPGIANFDLAKMGLPRVQHRRQLKDLIRKVPS
jgi:hypothetical protein